MPLASSASADIHNPVLSGFHPDPSIVQVGEDYFLATSTFEWFPGVRLHRSRDLAHWTCCGHALTTKRQLELLGVPDSAGVWAPSLTWKDDRFWLLFSVVRTRVGPFKDLTNYVITAPAIDGPWSDPVALDGRGFDASLFHDEDGRSWLVEMEWDFRKGQPRFGGIVLQEFDRAACRLIGPATTILRKPQLIEGPNLYRRDGWYYLMLAEGGTGWNHGISMARSRTITGPYDLDPLPLLLTSRLSPGAPLQKAGHGELVVTPAGEWWLAHLCSRPLYPERRCMLGRETALQRVEWNADGWLRLAHGGTEAATQLPAALGHAPHPWPQAPARDDFDTPELGVAWATLREPADASWADLRSRPGWLRLHGRDSLHSLHHQSLVAQRLTAFHCRVETTVVFNPERFSQTAGLIFWYDTRTHFYLRISRCPERGRIVSVVLTDDGVYDELPDWLSTDGWECIHLRGELAYDKLRFLISRNGSDWHRLGGTFDASKLSDDYGQGLHFTGAFAGICVQDLSGFRRHADFDHVTVQVDPAAPV